MIIYTGRSVAGMRKMALFLLITSFMLVGCSRQEILVKCIISVRIVK